MFDGLEIEELAAALREDLTLALGAAERAARAALFRELAALGHSAVRPAHLPVFAGIKAGGSRISELAASGGMTRQAMSMLVRDVEDAGYVRSVPDPSDGRATLVTLTDLGADFCRDAARSSRKVTARFAQGLGAERLSQTLAVVVEIAALDGADAVRAD